MLWLWFLLLLWAVVLLFIIIVFGYAHQSNAASAKASFSAPGLWRWVWWRMSQSVRQTVSCGQSGVGSGLELEQPSFNSLGSRIQTRVRFWFWVRCTTFNWRPSPLPSPCFVCNCSVFLWLFLCLFSYLAIALYHVVCLYTPTYTAWRLLVNSQFIYLFIFTFFTYTKRNMQEVATDFVCILRVVSFVSQQERLLWKQYTKISHFVWGGFYSEFRITHGTLLHWEKPRPIPIQRQWRGQPPPTTVEYALNGQVEPEIRDSPNIAIISTRLLFSFSNTLPLSLSQNSTEQSTNEGCSSDLCLRVGVCTVPASTVRSQVICLGRGNFAPTRISYYALFMFWWAPLISLRTLHSHSFT